MLRETVGVHDGLPYLLFAPTAREDEAGIPVIVFLHGRDERSDSVETLDLLRRHGLSRLASQGLLPRIHGQEFPFLLACPQTKEWWRDHAERIVGLIDKLVAAHGADTSRCYLTGISMGAYGSWLVAVHALDRFAALVPVSGDIPHEAQALRDTPVWVFLGGHDVHYPVINVKRNPDAFRTHDAETTLTVDPGAGHDEDYWSAVYGRSYVYEWLLSRRRSPTRESSAS